MLSRIVLILFFLAIVPNVYAETPLSERLALTDEGTNFLLSVPVSNLELLIPKGNLSNQNLNIGGSTSNPRYFNFSDNTQSLIISGWFEPEQKYAGLDNFWKDEKSTIVNKMHLTPENISLSKNNDWEIIAYDINIQGYTSFNLKAELTRAGSWLDIHISTTAKNLTDSQRAAAVALLNSLIVREKVTKNN